MMKAIDLDPVLFQASSAKLQQDVELQVMVCAKVSDMMELAKLGIEDVDNKQISKYAKQKAKDHHGFLTFLCCVLNASASKQPIVLLNQGPTTSMAYNHLVAEYIDVPIGMKLRCIRQCMDNIHRFDASN